MFSHGGQTNKNKQANKQTNNDYSNMDETPRKPLATGLVHFNGVAQTALKPLATGLVHFGRRGTHKGARSCSRME